MAFGLLTVALASLALLYVAYQRLFSPLASIPGPLNASLSKWWLIKHTRKGDFHRQIVHLHSVYGPLVRIAPNQVSITDPGAMKKIYGLQ